MSGVCVWLCPRCGEYLKPQNMKYGALHCYECGAMYSIGEDVQALYDAGPSLPPPIPDPESDDE